MSALGISKHRRCKKSQCRDEGVLSCLYRPVFSEICNHRSSHYYKLSKTRGCILPSHITATRAGLDLIIGMRLEGWVRCNFDARPPSTLPTAHVQTEDTIQQIRSHRTAHTSHQWMIYLLTLGSDHTAHADRRQSQITRVHSIPSYTNKSVSRAPPLSRPDQPENIVPHPSAT